MFQGSGSLRRNLGRLHKEVILVLSTIGSVGVCKMDKKEEGYFRLRGKTHANTKTLMSVQGIWRDLGSSLWPKHDLFKEKARDGGSLCRALNASQV